MDLSPRWNPGARVLLFLAVLAMLTVASFHHSWLIDDAGISLAYARNFSQGHGLVSQPGVPPVEGYSNPLWVLLLGVCYGLGLIHLPGSLKALSLVFVALAGLALHRALRVIIPAAADWVLAGTALLCAGNISVVLWCFSGLENPLYLALILGALALTLEAQASPDAANPAYALGGVAGALVWTRPDGLAFALLPLACVLARGVLTRNLRALPPRWVTRYLSVAAGLVAALFLMRRLYFGAWMPNTYLVKGGVGLSQLVSVALLQPDAIEKALQVTTRLFGSRASHPVLLAALAAMVLGAHLGRWRPRHDALPVFAGGALAVYLLLPTDWMIETRFATAFYPLCYAWVLVLVAEATAGLEAGRRGRMVGLAAVLLALAASPDGYYRILSAAGQGNVGVGLPARAYGDRFNQMAQVLGLEQASLAVQDLGGTLLTSRLRVFDLAGLCDRRVAATLDKDPAGLREYLFGAVRPDFLVLQGGWARAIAADQDPRFRAEYLPLHEHAPGEPGAVEGHPAGVYLRKEHVVGRPELLARLRAVEHRLAAFDVEPDRGPAWGWFLRLPLPHPPAERLRHPTLAAPAASDAGQLPAS